MSISRRSVLAAMASTTLAAALPRQAPLARRDFRVTTVDGVGIHVREVKPDSPGGLQPVLLIHGARVPGVASFDLDVPNGSLAAELALRLKRAVYIMDARGYGGSDRPPEMDRPPAEHRPLSRAYEVVRDIDAVTRAITQATGTGQVDLVGWATGGAWAAYYASLWPERVAHLVTLNALYGATTASAAFGPNSNTADPAHPDRLNATIGAYSLNTAAGLLPGWDRSIPDADKTSWRDPAIADAYVIAALRSDPESGEREPAAFRAPLGAIEDSFYQAAGRRLYDASSITSQVLIVHCERDFWSRPEDAVNFNHDLVRAKSTRVLTIPNATHFVHLDRPERGRDLLLSELVCFLGDCKPGGQG
jgi:pimeloyl-ACP methyl ester carboxylesterase